MGVVHKLQDEVRDFILAEKKAFSQISCRKLSDVVFEKFHIVVSKSSISAILKSANLSSPVGRHSFSVVEPKVYVKKSEKKFKIPQHKKNEIFPVPQSTSLEEKDVPVEQVILSPHVLPQKEALSPVSQKQGIALQNAGTIFLKAAEWKLAGKSILAKILKEELPGFNHIDFDEIAYALLFAQINKKQNPRELESVLAAAENVSDWGIKLAIEIESLLQRVAFIKMVGQADHVVIADTGNINVQSGNVQFGNNALLIPLLQRVEKEIVQNVHSAIFTCTHKSNQVEESAKILASIFETAKTEEIALYDIHQSQLVQSKYFITKQRTFILALSAWEKIFPRLAISWVNTPTVDSLSILNKTFFYKICQTVEIIQQSHDAKTSIYAITLSYFPTEKPFVVLLTNVANDTQAIKNAVEDFLIAWPNLMGDNNESKQTSVFEQNILTIDQLGQAKSLLESVQAFKKLIHTFSRQYFFASNEPDNAVNISYQEIYELPGFILEEKRIESVSFELAPKDLRFTILKNAINRFNSQVIFDPQGRRVVLEIHPTEN